MSETNEPTKEEIANRIRTLWSALIVPKWTYDELVALGKMVYSKIALAKIDPDVMKLLLPKLTQVARHIKLTKPTPAATPPEPTPPEAA
jgi:hypothetical protein